MEDSESGILITEIEICAEGKEEELNTLTGSKNIEMGAEGFEVEPLHGTASDNKARAKIVRGDGLTGKWKDK